MRQAGPRAGRCTSGEGITRHGLATGSVPVLRRVAETLAYGHGPISAIEERSEEIIGEIIDGLVVDVVLDLQVVSSARISPGDGIVPDVLANLDLGRIIVQVTFSIEIEVYNVVAKRSQLGPASICWADRKRGPARISASTSEAWEVHSSYRM